MLETSRFPVHFIPPPSPLPGLWSDLLLQMLQQLHPWEADRLLRQPEGLHLLLQLLRDLPGAGAAHGRRGGAGRQHGQEMVGGRDQPEPGAGITGGDLQVNP